MSLDRLKQNVAKYHSLYAALKNAPNSQYEENTLLAYDGNNFRIEKKIGKGAYGKILLVKNLQTDDVSVIKVQITKLTAPNPKARAAQKKHAIARAETEAEVLHRLKRGYAKIIDVKSKNELTTLIIMDFIPGDSVDKLLNKNNKDNMELSVEDKVKIALDITKDLAELHQQGAFHNDPKPANMLYDAKAKKAYLIDFGSANLKGSDLSEPGTYAYLAPERRNGQEFATPDTDIYFFGMALAEIFEFGRWSEKNSFVFSPKPNDEMLGKVYDLVQTMLVSDPPRTPLETIMQIFESLYSVFTINERTSSVFSLLKAEDMDDLLNAMEKLECNEQLNLDNQTPVFIHTGLTLKKNDLKEIMQELTRFTEPEHKVKPSKSTFFQPEQNLKQRSTRGERVHRAQQFWQMVNSANARKTREADRVKRNARLEDVPENKLSAPKIMAMFANKK